MIFGKSELDGGTPSLFGSTIGKMMGGYKPAQTGLLGTRMNPMYVSWAGDFNNMGVSTKTTRFINGKEKTGNVSSWRRHRSGQADADQGADGHVAGDADVDSRRCQPDRCLGRRDDGSRQRQTDPVPERPQLLV
jgi:hypothetical protein